VCTAGQLGPDDVDAALNEPADVGEGHLLLLRLRTHGPYVGQRGVREPGEVVLRQHPVDTPGALLARSFGGQPRLPSSDPFTGSPSWQILQEVGPNGSTRAPLLPKESVPPHHRGEEKRAQGRPRDDTAPSGAQPAHRRYVVRLPARPRRA